MATPRITNKDQIYLFFEHGISFPKGTFSYIKGHREFKNKKEVISPEYNSYRNMLFRCYYKSSQEWEIYGGSSIKVCLRWVIGENNKKGFECFLEDMGPRPNNKTLNRKNPLENYTPTNCEWADSFKQAVDKNRKVGSTGVRGITYCPKRKKYIAQIMRKYKRYYSKWCESKEEAFLEYNKLKERIVYVQNI